MPCKIISVFITLIFCTFFFAYLNISSIDNEPEFESVDKPKTTRLITSFDIKTLPGSDFKKLQLENETSLIATNIQTNSVLSITQSPPLPQNMLLDINTIGEVASPPHPFSILTNEVNSSTIVKNSDTPNFLATQHPSSRKFQNIDKQLSSLNRQEAQISAIPTERMPSKKKIKTNLRKRILISKSEPVVIKKSNTIKNLLSSSALPSNDKKKSSISRQPTKSLISSRFGKRIDPINNKVKFHKGIDISRPKGTEVLAWSDGVVTRNGWLRGYGLTVDVTHADGIKTRYAHLMRTTVQEGQKIDKGQIVGQVGETGRTTGSNLHFEVAVAGKISDPLNYLSEIYEIVGNNINTTNERPSTLNRWVR